VRNRYRTILPGSSRRLIAAIVLACSAVSLPGVRFIDTAGSGPDSIASVKHQGVVAVAPAALAKRCNIVWRWDSTAEELTCSKTPHSVTFVQDVPFYRSADSIIQIPYPPFGAAESLFLRVQDLAAAFRNHLGIPLQWRDDSLTLTLGDSAAPKIDNADSLERVKAAARRVERDSVLKTRIRQSITDDRGEKVKVVVIDAGHGGRDPGAIGPGGVQEKDIALAIAKSLRDIIKKESDITVFLTRETDMFVPLTKRTRFANDKKADLFISIHANSISGNTKKKMQIQGYKIYFLSQEKNDEDKMVAMQENSVIELEDAVDRGNYLQNVLIDMAGNEFLSESQDIAIMLDESFAGTLKEVPRLHLGVGQARFYVLNGAYMPAILLETAFISHPVEEKLLKTEKFQSRASRAIFDALITFKRKYEAGL
jgi:N-acetylmuramoyl-L-alanine amidase